MSERLPPDNPGHLRKQRNGRCCTILLPCKNLLQHNRGIEKMHNRGIERVIKQCTCSTHPGTRAAVHKCSHTIPGRGRIIGAICHLVNWHDNVRQLSNSSYLMAVI